MEIVMAEGTYRILTELILGLLLVFLGISLWMIIIRVFRNMIRAYRSRNIEFDETKIFEYIYDGKPIDSLNLTVNSALRDHLVKIASNIYGEEKLKINLLYQNLGYYMQDVEAIRRGFPKERNLALFRLRHLEIPLPEEGWYFCLTQNNQIFRWAAMEFLINTKKSRSILWLMQFLKQTSTLNAGIVGHLFACMAKHYPEGPNIILIHSDTPKLTEICIKTLASYPISSAHGPILQALKESNSDETFISAVQALGEMPSQKVLKLYHVLCFHPHFVVRKKIARKLVHFDGEDVVEILRTLSLDSNYYVRMEAMDTLLAMSPLTDELIIEIYTEQEHPSHRLLHHVEELRNTA